jgi:hypothetical protein
LSLWLETRPANDAPDNAEWRRYSEDLQSLAEAESRAAAIIRCKVVTPDGVRIVWTPGGRGEEPRRAVNDGTGSPVAVASGAARAIPEHLRGVLDG